MRTNHIITRRGERRCHDFPTDSNNFIQLEAQLGLFLHGTFYVRFAFTWFFNHVLK